MATNILERMDRRMTEVGKVKKGDFMCIHGASSHNEDHRLIKQLVGTVQIIQDIRTGWRDDVNYRALEDGYSWISADDCYVIPFEDMPYLEITKLGDVPDDVPECTSNEEGSVWTGWIAGGQAPAAGTWRFEIRPQTLDDAGEE